MSAYDESRQLLALAEQLSREQKKLSRLIEQLTTEKIIFEIEKVLWKIKVEPQTEKERELLRLVRESENPPAALLVALDAVAVHVSSGGGGGNG